MACHYWKCNFPLNPHVRQLVGRSDFRLVGWVLGWSGVCHKFLKERKVTLPCSSEGLFLQLSLSNSGLATCLARPNQFLSRFRAARLMAESACVIKTRGIYPQRINIFHERRKWAKTDRMRENERRMDK